MAKKEISSAEIINNNGCFDLQFRKDTRKERTNSPTYYRWKAQFIVTTSLSDIKFLQKIKKEFDCGEISQTKDQARFSVQKIDDIADIVIPFLKKNSLHDNKKKNFELWAKGVGIMQNNKGTKLADWKKTDINSLIEIHKSCAKYKSHPRTPKWLDMARNFSKVN